MMIVSNDNSWAFALVALGLWHALLAAVEAVDARAIGCTRPGIQQVITMRMLAPSSLVLGPSRNIFWV